MGGILGSLGIDPFYLFVILFVLQVAIIVLLCLVYDKYNRLQNSYNVFMKGKSLEKSIFRRFEKLKKIEKLAEKNREEIDKIYKKMEGHYQKVGIVKYDAFHEMGGDLSFALTMLDENNTGWILNAMHSREGCYTYIKEVIKGESYIELSEEERDCLEKAIYQEEYDIKSSKN